MAIDEKFITSGVSKETVDAVNKRSRRKRKRPKPWDSSTEAPNRPTLGATPPPTDTLDKPEITEPKANLGPKNIQHKPDTYPAQIQHISNTDNRHISSTNPTQTERKSIKSSLDISNTNPTRQTYLESQNKNISNNSDEIRQTYPTQITDTNPTQRTISGKSVSDIVGKPKDSENPTQIRYKKVRINSNSIYDTYPTQITDTNPTQAGTYPTQSAYSDLDIRHVSSTNPTPKATQITELNNEPLTVMQIQKDISLLQGNKLRLAHFIARYLIEINQNNFSTTYDVLALNAEISKGSIRTTLKRLKKNNFVEIVASGPGRGARIQISMTPTILRAFTKALFSTQHIPARIQHNSNTTTDTKTSSKLVTNKKETNFTNRKEEAYSYYENVDFSYLETNEVLLNNRITKEKVIGEIAKNEWKIKPYDLQETISKFGVYVSNKDNVYNVRSIQGFFFSQLKKLSQGDFLDIEGISSPEDNSLAEIKKRMLARKAQREQMKQEIMDLAFDEWWDLSSPSERESLAPSVFKISSDPDMIRRGVRGVWEAEIWPYTSEAMELAESLKSSSKQSRELQAENQFEDVEKNSQIGQNTPCE